MAFNLGYTYPPYTIWEVDAKGTAVRKIVDPDPGEGGILGRGQYGYYADVSPDGSRIVYSTCEYTYFDHDRVGWRYNLGYELAAVNVDGSGVQRLTDNLHFENYPTWSPDGTRVAFIAHNDYSRAPDYDYYLFPDHYDPHNSEIFTRATDGRDERVVPNTKGVLLYPPVWSPGGHRLAFTVNGGWDEAREPIRRILYTVRLDGSELSRIATRATTLPTWSADGDRVAYGLDGRVYTVRYDGTDRRRVVGDFSVHDVSWSPDGSEILLASDRGVYVVRPDGSGLRGIGPPVRTTEATWSPDASMIAARHEPDPEDTTWRPWIFVIFTMDRDGTDVRFLARGFLEDRDSRGKLKIQALGLAPIDPATCLDGLAVPRPEVNPGLVEDCKVLVWSRDALGSGATSGWTTDKPVAQWPGVVVNGDPPRVRGLFIGGITGTLPPEIGDLTMLERLSLHNNILLIGPIPPELGNLTNLRVLGLRDNNLSGAIPPELGNLTMLGGLELSHNNLSGAIPPELGNLTMLVRRRFGLSHNNLSGCVPVELSDMWVEASGLPRCKP